MNKLVSLLIGQTVKQRLFYLIGALISSVGGAILTDEDNKTIINKYEKEGTPGKPPRTAPAATAAWFAGAWTGLHALGVAAVSRRRPVAISSLAGAITGAALGVKDQQVANYGNKSWAYISIGEYAYVLSAAFGIVAAVIVQTLKLGRRLLKI